MNVILSIRPKYAERILTGVKNYEFRKNSFRRNDISTYYIYATSPVKKIIGFFTVSAIHKDIPSKIWSQHKHSSGISQEDFFAYYSKSEFAYAIEIDKRVRFSSPIEPTTVIPGFRAPQSYLYTNISIPNTN